MEPAKSLSYYVTVRVNGTTLPDPYLCLDLSVRVGDEVLVRTEKGTVTIASVVSCKLRSAEDAPCPPEKMKTVLCRIGCGRRSGQTAPPYGESVPPKKDRTPYLSSGPVHWEPNPRKKPGRSFDLFAALIAMIVYLPVLLLIFGLIAAFLLCLFGWDGEGGLWPLLLFALPFAIASEIWAIENPDAAQSEAPASRRAGGTAGSSSDGPSDGGWYPGCPEDKMFSSMDDAFDFDGDGRLNDAEHAAKYDVFFGDDE